jgi:C_GCAxxG_C_C family probable redox protein
MADYEKLKAKVQELADRDWDVQSIEQRYGKLAEAGIPDKRPDRDKILVDRQRLLTRVQRKAEEYNLLAENCAMSTALALMEELGLGNLEIVKALSPFPGFGATGWICGGVTGALIALGLYFGGDTILDHEATGAAIMAARKFMPRFEEEVGSVLCPQIHEKIVFGRYMDPAASPENMKAFAEAKGFEKCGLLPGIGARLAAEIIIENMAEKVRID